MRVLVVVVGGCAMGETALNSRLVIAIPERPKNPTGTPVALPKTFANWLEVVHFFRTHDAVLTDAQVEQLARIHDALKAREDRAPRALERSQASPETLLTLAWREACQASPDDGERNSMIAEAACGLLGARGPMQLHRVLKLYEQVGVRATNRAVIELAKESLDPVQRFKFLEHRAKVERDRVSA